MYQNVHICPFLIYMLLTFDTFWFVFIIQWWRVILISALLSSIFHSIVNKSKFNNIVNMGSAIASQ